MSTRRATPGGPGLRGARLALLLVLAVGCGDALAPSGQPDVVVVTQGFLAHRRQAAAVESTGRERVQLNRIPQTIATLPEHFGAAGYTTLGIATNINVGPEIGFARGFDHFRRLELRPVTPAERSRMVVPRARASATAGDVLAALAPWEPLLAEASPRFVYPHLNDVHAPYCMRDPW